MRKILVAVCIISIFIALVGMAMVETLSDPVFEMATATLTASKTASFSAVTFANHSSIKVTAVELEQYDGSSWHYYTTLQAPSDEARNTDLYGANKDYSSDIASGRFRLKVTFNADGYTITRYSNARTY